MLKNNFELKKINYDFEQDNDFLPSLCAKAIDFGYLDKFMSQTHI